MTTLARACGLPLEDWHRRGWRGGGLRIAHLDSGIDMDLPLFAGRLAGVLATGRAGDIRSREWVEDRTGHGTFTASLLCRIAPEARLLAAEVTDDHPQREVVARFDPGADEQAVREGTCARHGPQRAG